MAKRETQSAASSGQPGALARVVVKLAEGWRVPYVSGGAELLVANGFTAFEGKESALPDLVVRPLLRRTHDVAEKLSAADAPVRRRDRWRSILSYRGVSVADQKDLGQVAEFLRGLAGVELVYIDPGPVEPPAPLTGSNPDLGKQGHLNPGPEGVGAAAAWKKPGGQGEGIGFLDVEQAWWVDHRELADHDAQLVSGVNHDEEKYAEAFQHGTKVLGVVVGLDNDEFGVGVAPRPKFVKLAAQYRSDEEEYSYNTAAALDDAIEELEKGDVLLICAQTNLVKGGKTVEKVPIEVLPSVRELIEEAVFEKGIVVVEAAGNGDVDLDKLEGYEGVLQFQRGTEQERDSGAILVASAFASAPGGAHAAMPLTNHGSRIDCYAWGEKVGTPTTDAQQTDHGWTSSFEQTSAACAIIAGVALCVQGLHEEHPQKQRLSGEEMRKLLGEPGTGTPSSGTKAIGPMPDLQKIIDTHGL